MAPKQLVLVLVLVPVLASNLASSLMLSPEQKVETLGAHNRLRRSVYPPASNMNYLTWNIRLEDLAQQAANRCVFEHNYGGDYASLGENLYLGGRTNTSEMVTLFFMEHLAYNYDTGACNKPNVFNFASCGHYLQVVGSSVLEVGCAIASCGIGNLFVCEYNSMAPSPVYTTGKACAGCSATGFCYDGLCLNGTMRNYMVAEYNASVSCSLDCKNCGSRAEILAITPPICTCSCPSGYGGYDCATKNNPSAPALTCSVCTQRGTPCQNGGTENSTGTTCSCSCPGNFTGPQCQLSRDAYTSALLLQLRRGSTICTNGQCTSEPYNPLTFTSQVWPVLQPVLVASVNAFCRVNFARCCGAGLNPPPGGGTGDLLLTSDLRYVDFSVGLNGTGQLAVAVYAAAQSDNSLCASGSIARRRRRAAAISSALSVTVLADALNSANGSISDNLTSCCGVTVGSASDYKAVVDVQFGYAAASSSGDVGASTTASSSGGGGSSASTTPAGGNGSVTTLGTTLGNSATPGLQQGSGHQALLLVLVPVLNFASVSGSII